MTNKIVGAGDARPSVMVAIPAHDQVPSTFMYDLGQMMAFMGAGMALGKIGAVNLSMQRGTYIHQARQTLAVQAIENEVDHILWLDSDMRFPRDVYLRLAARQVPFVGVNYSTRGAPPRFVAIKDVDAGTRCATRADSTGLEEVDSIGFGCVLMETALLADLHNPYGEKGPWFNFEWDASKGSMWGEDVLFCRYLREAGQKVYVDHDVSKLCGHVGHWEYTCKDAEIILNLPAEDDA